MILHPELLIRARLKVQNYSIVMVGFAGTAQVREVSLTPDLPES